LRSAKLLQELKKKASNKNGQIITAEKKVINGALLRHKKDSSKTPFSSQFHKGQEKRCHDMFFSVILFLLYKQPRKPGPLLLQYDWAAGQKNPVFRVKEGGNPPSVSVSVACPQYGKKLFPNKNKSPTNVDSSWGFVVT